ncbi:LysM peptidoglycan-binding domain-containing protein [Algicella marina]|uniref:LysM peptidoglycan-binding domain-containing protein n=1 Tax=Algicella marina TaxID=2683284 RepID=A0A6P1SWM8_9RHOB|nr:LysM peptidoglycan-binding domain-containing protein [Algicella marina]QHQ33743.1 LysM peptidoglycan-binding domain-containing protein [Algicella marina]
MRAFSVAIMLFLAAVVPAASDDACPAHVVEPGDTLGNVALRYYGTRAQVKLLHDRNRNIIGPDLNRISPGQRLLLPCDDDSGLLSDAADIDAVEKPDPAAASSGEHVVSASFDDAAGTGAAVGETEEQVQDEAPSNVLTILAGGPFPPFAGEDLPGGGMIVELLEMVLQVSGETDYTLGFVNDRDAALDFVLPKGGFGLALPWVFPDCGAEVLEARDASLCKEFVASDGFYEFVTEFYARADSEFSSVVLPGGLTDTRLCRPQGHPLKDLVASGLLPGRLTLVQAADPEACLRALDAGEVDVASMDAAVTRALVDRIEIRNPIVVLENLTVVDRLRVLALRGDPESDERMTRINAGLQVLSEDGRWFGIVSRHLRGDRAKVN